VALVSLGKPMGLGEIRCLTTRRERWFFTSDFLAARFIAALQAVRFCTWMLLVRSKTMKAKGEEARELD
jgi:hypothetical protein